MTATTARERHGWKLGVRGRQRRVGVVRVLSKRLASDNKSLTFVVEHVFLLTV